MRSKVVWQTLVVAVMIGSPCAALQAQSIDSAIMNPNIDREQYAEDLLQDGAYLTACGPIACFVAAKSLGVDTNLKEMAAACKWEKGESTTLASIRDALHGTRRLKCSAVHVGPDQLAAIVGDGRTVAILPVRKTSEKTDHAICVARAGQSGFFTIDYPELGHWRTTVELTDIWDGEALIVSRKAFFWPGASRLAFLPALVGVVLIVFAWRRASLGKARELGPRALVLLLAALAATSGNTRSCGAAEDEKEVLRSISAPAPAAAQSHSFGVVDENRVFEHVFQIKNDSTRPIEIIKDRVTCGCLSVAKRPETIEPGGVGEMVVRLRTVGKRGLAHERAILQTTDPNRQYFQFSLKAIVKGVWAEPDHVDFGNLFSGQPAQRDFYLISAGFSNAAFDAAVPSDEHVQVSSSAAQSDERTRIQQINAFQHVSAAISTTGLPPGRFVSAIEVTTNDPAKSIRLPVTAFITGPIKCRPTKLAWTICYAGKEVGRTCTLTPIPAENGQIEPRQIRFSADHEFLSFALKDKGGSGDEGYDLEVLLTAPPNLQKEQLIRGTVVGSYDGGRVFAIPYTAYLVPMRTARSAVASP